MDEMILAWSYDFGGNGKTLGKETSTSGVQTAMFACRWDRISLPSRLGKRRHGGVAEYRWR